MKIVCIGDRNTVNALRLMSIEGKVVEEDEFLSQIEKKLKQKNYILLLPQQFTSGREKEIKTLKNRYTESLIVEIPDVHGTSEREKEIEKMISSTLGVKV